MPRGAPPVQTAAPQGVMFLEKSPLTPCRASLVLTAVCLVAGCNSADQSSDSEFVVRENMVFVEGMGGGEVRPVRIVESASPLFAEGAFWRLSREPELEIGLQDGPSEYLFGVVGDVVRLADGRVVALDRMSKDVRFFSATGEFLSRSGGEGEGPGEYAFPAGLTVAGGDSLYVLDQGRPRVTVLDSGGTLARTYAFRFGSEAPAGGPHEILEDGNVLMYGRGQGTPVDNAGLMRDTIQYHLWSSSGDYVGPLALLPGATRWSRPDLGEFLSYAPFAPGFWKAAGLASRALLGSGIEPEIQVWGSDARLETIIRWSPSGRAVTDELRSQYDAYHMDDGPESRRAGRRRWLDEVPYPDNLPTYADLLSDGEGNVWVRDYYPPWASGTSWTVLSPEFRWLGSLMVPDGFVIMQVAHGKVTGVHKDALGVDRIRVYTLIQDPSE